MSVSVAMLLWAAFALASGLVEGRMKGWIDHYVAAMLRLVVLLVLGLFVNASMEVLTLVPAAFGVFALVHRTAFNLTRGQSIDYMGPCRRTWRDSAYDEVWWSATAYRIIDTPDGGTLYMVSHPSRPWRAAVVFEVCAIILSITIYTVTT